MAISRKAFEKINQRRHELIEKLCSGFTDEENSRRFDKHPGWEAEFDQRCLANLTDDEAAELQQCTEAVDEWIEEVVPLPLPPDDWRFRLDFGG